MAGLNPRRLSGVALKLTARGERVPFVGGGMRWAARSTVPLDRLRGARLGAIPPYLTPDGTEPPPAAAPPEGAEA